MSHAGVLERYNHVLILFWDLSGKAQMNKSTTDKSLSISVSLNRALCFTHRKLEDHIKAFEVRSSDHTHFDSITITKIQNLFVKYSKTIDNSNHSPPFLNRLLSLKNFISTIIAFIILTISSPLTANRTLFYQYLLHCLS